MKRTANFVLATVMILGLTLSATFSLAADAGAVNMTGTWDLEVESPSGSGTPTFELVQEGNALSGTYEGAFGESEVTGTVDGNKFKLKFNSSGIEITYKGTIEGKAIKGTLNMGSYGDGTFTGEKSS